MEKSQIIAEIIRVAGEIGFNRKDWQKFVDTLNKQEITTTTGKAWSKSSLDMFCKREHIEFAIQPNAVQDTRPDEIQCAPLQDSEPIDEPARQESASVIQLNDHDAGELNELLTWWKENKGVMMPKPIDIRPSFKRGSVQEQKTVTFRFNQELLNRARELAVSKKSLTGGTLNGLVEVLLWQALGSPDDLID
ncbi:hypothetical protein [Desulfomonile tiedjei]|uniref:Uncharacterized protein n=1 Tax=Desulfomonile tiedjei (strain ATCC 49306 / DSM 6799 / DCB-1) TaxID=706587 RepID=I4C5P6_DESTA|nr:hypothetical protein [Desulfomonile tiedjei]AFM24887.1 hypothetical protein Desti_2193 [Desulfomonile tiedjei DSM 6799]